MSRTLLRQGQLQEDTLTGASLNNSVGVYDETDTYAVGDQVYWARYVWECVTAVGVGSEEGDLTNAPDVSAAWERAPFTPAIVSVAADYNAAQTWLFDILEVDTSGGSRTVTLPSPAVTATWPVGLRLSIINLGTNNLIVDPNGNTLSGSATTKTIVDSNDWMEIAKINTSLVILRSDVNNTSIKARSWMGL